MSEPSVETFTKRGAASDVKERESSSGYHQCHVGGGFPSRMPPASRVMLCSTWHLFSDVREKFSTGPARVQDAAGQEGQAGVSRLSARAVLRSRRSAAHHDYKTGYKQTNTDYAASGPAAIVASGAGSNTVSVELPDAGFA